MACLWGRVVLSRDPSFSPGLLGSPVDPVHYGHAQVQRTAKPAFLGWSSYCNDAFLRKKREIAYPSEADALLFQPVLCFLSVIGSSSIIAYAIFQNAVRSPEVRSEPPFLSLSRGVGTLQMGHACSKDPTWVRYSARSNCRSQAYVVKPCLTAGRQGTCQEFGPSSVIGVEGINLELYPCREKQVL